MNTPNNKRRQASRKKIEQAFVELLQTTPLQEITVSRLCKITGLNRTTFYANYNDIYDLANQIRSTLEQDVSSIISMEIPQNIEEYSFVRLFQHIRDNQLLYKTYFQLGYDVQIDFRDTAVTEAHFQNQFVEYHLEFFKSGITRIIKMWLENGCRESPEEMHGILESEYRDRAALLTMGEAGKK